MSLLDPSTLEILKRFYAFRRVVVHALENDDAIFWDGDAVVVNPETVLDAEAVARQFVLNEQLGALGEVFLNLSYTDRAEALTRLARLSQTIGDEKVSEEMGFAAASTAMAALVSMWIKEWFKDVSGVESRSCASGPA